MFPDTLLALTLIPLLTSQRRCCCCDWCWIAIAVVVTIAVDDVIAGVVGDGVVFVVNDVAGFVVEVVVVFVVFSFSFVGLEFGSKSRKTSD